MRWPVRRIAAVFLALLAQPLLAQQPTLLEQASGVTAVLQAISPVNDSIVWVTGHAGVILRTRDGGRTWERLTAPAGDSLQFRDVYAVSADTAFVLSAGSGALSRIYRTTDGGASWERQFLNGDSAAFYDCFDFWYAQHGLVVSDAVDGHLVLRATADGGATWQPLPATATPAGPPGEGAFAASGTCLVVRPPHLAWVGTGAAGRGRVYRSADGGATWTRTLFVNDSTGIQKLAWAFDRPDVILAATDRHYTAPGGGGRGFGGAGPQSGPTGTALYKSADEGLTWHEITGGGLPRLFGRISVAVAMHTNARRVFLIGNFGLCRSDDGGTAWRQMDPDDRRVGNGQGGYNCGVYVSPDNPDIVYTVNTSSYVSTDGGNTFAGFKGAPGGDDPQQMWLDPTNGQRIFLGMDQGATVSLDGGQTWSPWYNQLPQPGQSLRHTQHHP